MEVLGEISNFCRFCLNQDTQNLMLLSSAIEGLSFSVQDIQQTTGISILESETAYLAICIKCKTRVEFAVDFRRSCLEGNAKFLQLFGYAMDKLRSSDIAEENLAAATSIKNDPLKIELTLPNELNNENSLEAQDGPALLVEESQEVFGEQTANELQDCDNESSSSENVQQIFTKELISNKKTKNIKKTVTTSNRKQVKSKEWIGESDHNQANKPQKRKTSGKHRKRLCSICGALVYDLTVHTRSHTKENLLKCPHCPVQMACGTNLLTHIRLVHEKVIVKSCEPCGKGFITLNTYTLHMLTHHNIGKRYQCEICHRMFNNAAGRREHMKRIHIAEYKYECQICPKKFKEKDALKRHGRVHSTNTPYGCSQCPKRFKSAFAKKTHEITHSGIQFACTLCSKVYRYKSLLSMHYRKCHPAECSGESTQQSDPICDQ